MEEELKKGDVVEIQIPSASGEVTVAYVLDVIWTQVADEYFELDYIMYSQNRLFRMHGTWQHVYCIGCSEEDYDEVLISTPEYVGIIAEYVVIPEVDSIMG